MIVELVQMINVHVGNEVGGALPSVASVDRAKELIGYEPHISFETGWNKAIAWFWENWDRIQPAAHFGPGVSSEVGKIFNQNDL